MNLNCVVLRAVLAVVNLLMAAAASAAQLDCNDGTQGLMRYVPTTQSIEACVDQSWVEVQRGRGEDVSIGAQGPTGPKGEQGPAGSDGLGYEMGVTINTDETDANIQTGTADYFLVTGSAPLMSLASAVAGKRVLLKFGSTMTVVHDQSKIILSGGADFKFISGDKLELISEGNGIWREIDRKSNNESYVWAAMLTAQTIQASTATAVLMDEELADTQNEYDPGTGVFTAKQSGLYRFNVHMRSANINWNSGNHMEVEVRKSTDSGANWTTISIGREAAFTNITQRLTVFSSATVRLIANDQMMVQLTSSKANPMEGASANSSVYWVITRVR